MIYSCKDVTLQNRKFSEFIDIDNEELLPGSVDNDTIYLSGYVEGDENNQNIKIKVSQLAEKVATDTGLVTNITEGVLETVTIGTITEKVKETVAEYINGTEEGGPSEVEKIIDEKIDEKTSKSLENYYTKTDINDKNFISSTEYATTNKAGLVKLKTPTTTFSLRTVSADETDTSAPSVYTADDVDAELSKLEVSLGEAINEVSDKVSKIDYERLENDVKSLKELDIDKALNRHSISIDENKESITNIENEIGTSTDDNKKTLWNSIESLEEHIDEISANCATNQDLNGAIGSFEQKINELDEKFVTLEDVADSNVISQLKNDIEELNNNKIGKPSDDEINKDVWSKIRSLEGEIDNNTNRIASYEETYDTALGIANNALNIANDYDDQIKLLNTTIDEVKSTYISEEKLNEKNFVNDATLNAEIVGLKGELKKYTNDEINKLNISELREDVVELQGNYNAITSIIGSIELNAKNANEASQKAKEAAEAAKEAAKEAAEGTVSEVQTNIERIENLVNQVTDRLDDQDGRIDTVDKKISEAIGTVNEFEGRVSLLEEELSEDGAIKTDLHSQGERITDLEELVGEGPIDTSNIEHINVPENSTVVAHINNINEIIDVLRENVDDHHGRLKSHERRLGNITNTIGTYTENNEGEPVKQLCENAEDVLKRTDIANWPDKFSKIKDLWSGLYYICDIVGFDHYNEYLPAEPDKRNVITELSGLSGQISVNTNDIRALNERLDLFNSAIGTAELNRAGIVSIISSVNDEDYVGGNVNIADPGTTAVSIDYFEKHKPAPFVESEEEGEEENQYRKKGTVYVQYKNQDDNNEQPIVYSKDAIDAKLEEEYSSKNSGLIYHSGNENKTFSLGRNNIQDSIENVPIPSECPAMCVTRQGIYVTVFYGEDGVAEPQENNRGWRWVMLGTVPQEFVASDTSGPATS